MRGETEGGAERSAPCELGRRAVQELQQVDGVVGAEPPQQPQRIAAVLRTRAGGRAARSRSEMHRTDESYAERRQTRTVSAVCCTSLR